MSDSIATLAEAFGAAVRHAHASRGPQCPSDILQALTLTLARKIAECSVELEAKRVPVEVEATVDTLVEQLRVYPYAQAIAAGRDLRVEL